jgi:mono/diheme cytochrome c family protein
MTNESLKLISMQNDTFASMKTIMMKGVCFVLMICLLACNGGNENKKGLGLKDSLKETIDSEDLAETGQSIFLQRCATCHAVNMTLTGPALKGVEKRWHNKQNLYAYIRNSQEMIAKGGYAKDLFDTYNKVVMPPFTDLKDEDLQAILAYIKNAEESNK